MTKEAHYTQANKLVSDIQMTVKKKNTALKLKGLWAVALLFVVIILCGYSMFVLIKTGLLSFGTNSTPSSQLSTSDGLIVTCYGLIIVVALVICVCGINRAKVYKSRETKLCKELYDLRTTYLCERFELTRAQLSYDLTGILNAHPQFKTDWWKHNDNVDVIENALDQKYRRNSTEVKASELHIENLKLQNESLEIDNSQKKFWVCTFCGNTNRGDDMSCIKCGGIRP